MIDPVWEKLEKIKALRKLWLDVVGLAISGIDLKNEVLHITLAHPAYLQEWRIGEERYLQALREEYKKRELKKVAVFKKIQCSLAPQAIKKEPSNPKINETYEERSVGDFEIKCNNPSLKHIFEKIQNTIRNQHDRKAENLS